jgi:2-haloacid dehalogenase
MYAWITAGERDYSYLSVIKEYKIFIDIMAQSFVRLLYQAGVPDPTNFATKEDVAFVISEYKKLKPRPGLSEMMHTLRSNGFEVWCCSDANVDRVKGYFDGAGVEMPMDHILSADMVQAGKPEPKVYKMAREKARADEPGEVSIFAGEFTICLMEKRNAFFLSDHSRSFYFY